MKDYPEEFPWGEFLKECIPLAAILVVYFAVQIAISWDSIAWMIGGAK